jgi:hypothetical protein
MWSSPVPEGAFGKRLFLKILTESSKKFLREVLFLPFAKGGQKGFE